MVNFHYSVRRVISWLTGPCSLAGIIAMGMGLFPHNPAYATPMSQVRSIAVDCRDLKESIQSGHIQPWQSFVKMEHCDRIKRLLRLSADLPPHKRPIFFEGIVPAERLPASFGVDVPVLRVVFPDHVFFDTAQSRLRPEAYPLAAIIAESLRRDPPDVALFVSGHADQRGDADYNLNLSIDRSNILAEVIFDHGIAHSSIWRIGFGEDMPLFPGDDEASLSQNRRIEFLFAAKPEAVGAWLAGQQLSELCQAKNIMESQGCKKQLKLRRDYEALEITRKPAARISPQQKSRQAATPRNAGPRGIAPNDAKSRSLQPVTSGIVSVTPAPSRRMRIDPVQGKATPVRIDL